MGMAWWDTWYENATHAISGAMQASQSIVAPLFKEPPTGSGAYNPDDAPLSDILRARQSGTPYDLFNTEPGPLINTTRYGSYAVTTDLQQQILERPKTWDEMSWWEKAKTYTTDIIPKAAMETVGIAPTEQPGTTVATRPGTFSDRLRSGAEETQVVTAPAEVGGAVKRLVANVPKLIDPDFLKGSLTRVILIVVGLVVLIFLANRFLAKRGI